MKTAPKVSVVIPCFNHGDYLLEAVESVNAIARDDIEIVVVDDGSTDDRTLIEIDKIRTNGIKVIRQENRGLGAARNAGISASCGKYILPLDADDRLRPGWINTGIDILDTDPQVGVVYGDAQCFGTETRLWVVGPFNDKQLLKCNFIHCSALFRRSIWEQNGGYETQMPIQGWEDWDFWLSTYKHGWLFKYLPQAVFDYRRTAGSMITRNVAFEDQINEFVATKHGILYRKAWLSSVSEQQSKEMERQSKENERQSIKWALRHLTNLLRRRLRYRRAKQARASSV